MKPTWKVTIRNRSRLIGKNLEKSNRKVTIRNRLYVWSVHFLKSNRKVTIRNYLSLIGEKQLKPTWKDSIRNRLHLIGKNFEIKPEKFQSKIVYVLSVKKNFEIKPRKVVIQKSLTSDQARKIAAKKKSNKKLVASKNGRDNCA